MKLMKIVLAVLVMVAMVTPVMAEDRLSLSGSLQVRRAGTSKPRICRPVPRQTPAASRPRAASPGHRRLGEAPLRRFDPARWVRRRRTPTPRESRAGGVVPPLRSRRRRDRPTARHIEEHVVATGRV